MLIILISLSEYPMFGNEKYETQHFSKLDALLMALLLLERGDLFIDIPDELVDDTEFAYEAALWQFANAQKPYEQKLLTDRLLDDKYISFEKRGRYHLPTITIEGIKFLQQGGYYQKYTDQKIDRKIKQKTLAKFAYDKVAFWLSILSIIIALIALLSDMNYIPNLKPTKVDTLS